jgi:hypothetical protein
MERGYDQGLAGSTLLAFNPPIRAAQRAGEGFNASIGGATRRNQDFRSELFAISVARGANAG